MVLAETDTVILQDVVTRFKKFLWNYTDRRTRSFKYRERISQMAMMGQRSLVIDFDDITLFDRSLAHLIEDNPDLAIEAASKAIRELLYKENPDYVEAVEKFYPRFRNLTRVLRIRELTSENIGKLVAVEGILTRLTKVEAKLVKAVYKHLDPECGAEFEWPPTGEMGERIEKPNLCPICGKGGKFQLILSKSRFIDWQKIVVQEKPEEIPPGQIPRSIEVVLTGDLVDTARPGDRVMITGILRVMPTSSIQKSGGKSVFSFYLDANYVDVQQKVLEEIEITREDEEKIREMARDPWIREKIIASIAPAIYGHWSIKEAIALLLFGGVPKPLPDGTRIRGDIHVLLVGDPGTAKSQMLQYTARLAPRGIYTSGKGSTAAGLTASVLRDKATGEYYLEAGALVIADGGVAAIDEIDKMREEDRSAIHEALEQQSYHKDFVIMFADGGKKKIGKLVDELFEKHKDETIYGLETEILPINNIFLIGYDPINKRQVIVKANRISRHRAPDTFVKITYSNGRSIKVTPEHPVLTIKNGQIITTDAIGVDPNTLVPGVSKLDTLTQHPLIRDLNLVVPRNGLPYIVADSIEYAQEIQDNLLTHGILTFIKQTKESIKIYPSGPRSLLRLLIEYNVEDVPFDVSKVMVEAGNAPKTWYEILDALGIPITNDIIEGRIELVTTHNHEINNAIRAVIYLKELLGIEAGIDEILYLTQTGKLVMNFGEKLQRLKETIRALEQELGDISIHLVTSVEIIENNDSKWVYDVTVEPYHLFISHGLILHNTISIAKAGIVARLNARAAVLAAGNPKFGRYDPKQPIGQNIDLPPPILSRFDLIFIIQDIPNEKRDRLLARHILSVHTNIEKAKPLIDTQMLKKYISYARRYIKPQLTQEAKKLLEEFYVSMRKASTANGSGELGPIAITPRQLEALIRLSEAHAKMALKPKATVEDAEEAIRLMFDSLKKVGLDIETGRIDIDIIMVGTPKSKQEKIKAFIKFIDEVFQEYDEIEYKTLFKMAEEKGFREKDFINEMIRRLKREGTLYEPRPGVLSKIY